MFLTSTCPCNALLILCFPPTYSYLLWTSLFFWLAFYLLTSNQPTQPLSDSALPPSCVAAKPLYRHHYRHVNSPSLIFLNKVCDSVFVRLPRAALECLISFLLHFVLKWTAFWRLALCSLHQRLVSYSGYQQLPASENIKASNSLWTQNLSADSGHPWKKTHTHTQPCLYTCTHRRVHTAGSSSHSITIRVHNNVVIMQKQSSAAGKRLKTDFPGFAWKCTIEPPLNVHTNNRLAAFVLIRQMSLM